MQSNILFLLLTLSFSNIALSKELNPHVAIKEAMDKNIKAPSPDPDGRVQTLNKKGAMSPQLDLISQAFVEFAAQPDREVLEIGAGYGLACLKALALGAKHYTVNDLDERHLQILAATIQESNPAFLQNIRLFSGSFPKDFKKENKTYDAILIARVLHFMNPEELKVTLEIAYKILKPGGKIYAVMLSPYVKGYKSFIPEFEERIQRNHPHPGYVENLLEYADKSLIPKNALKNTEEQFFFFDTRTASKAFQEAGFRIEKSIDMPLAYPSKIWCLDGRENVGVVAYKPLH